MKKILFISAAASIVFCANLRAGLVDGTASLVIGQTSFTDSGQGTAQQDFHTPFGVAIDSVHDRLFVSDSANNRILFWKNASTLANGQAADGVIGQSGNPPANNTLNTPYGICLDTSSNLWVADRMNHRVLRFSGTPYTGMAADFVIGEVNFSTAMALTPPTAYSLNQPYAVAVDSAGRVYVADAGNNRVLVYTQNSATATIELGQVDFVNKQGLTSPAAYSLNQPYGVFVATATGAVFVSDAGNHRVLKYTSLAMSATASLVLGQIDFVNGGINQGGGTLSPTNTSLYSPYSVVTDATGYALITVSDFSNNRILLYTSPASNGTQASYVLGQANFTSNSAPSPCTQTSLNGPSCVFADAFNNIWVADSANNRVLKFSQFRLASVVPAAGMTGLSNKSVTVTGEGMPQGTAIKLSRTGYSDITAIPGSYSYDSELSITCSFDLTNAVAGSWDVVVSTGAHTSKITGAFTIFAQNIQSVSPTSGQNGGSAKVTATANNGGFVYGTNFALTKTGQTSIYASLIAMSADETQISGTFDLTGAATGYWNVYVATGAINATLADHFLVSTSTVVDKYIDPTIENFVSVQGPQFGAVLDIPAGTFNSPVTVSLSLPNIAPQIRQSELKTMNVFFDVTDDKNIQPGNGITMTLTFVNNVISGLDKSKFRLCLYDSGLDRWSPVPSTAYPSQNKVVAVISHFSTYGLFQLVPASNLGGVHVYPDPYRPNSNTIYDNPALGQGIVFAGLPPKAHIKIFTISGELVKEIDVSTGDGNYLWDTHNAGGANCASGVYIYLVTSPEDPGSKSKGKFAIAE